MSLILWKENSASSAIDVVSVVVVCLFVCIAKGNDHINAYVACNLLLNCIHIHILHSFKRNYRSVWHSYNYY